MILLPFRRFQPRLFSAPKIFIPGAYDTKTVADFDDGFWSVCHGPQDTSM